MKQIYYSLALVCLLFSAAACETQEAPSGDPQAPYYLSASKNTIEADGKDTATLTLDDTKSSTT